ncbi:MAG: LTA synthase family protein [Clostridiales bacterium]|jgi:phosphoglycerol transferase MdoB-like AlkP superfamily enzyme|nr:LTA synthase family protein [Clostridiales bacterium]
MIDQKRIRPVLWGYAAIFPFLLFMALEMLNPASSAGLFVNAWESVGSLLLSVLVIMLMALVAYCFVGSILIAYGIVSFVLLLGYIVNYFKLMIAGGVFVPSDIFLAGAAFQVMEAGAVVISPLLIFGVLLVISLHLPLYFAKLSINFLRRLAILPVAVVFLLVFSTSNFITNHIHNALGLQYGTVTDRYRNHGMLLGFFSELSGQNGRSDADISEIVDGLLVIPENPGVYNASGILYYIGYAPDYYKNEYIEYAEEEAEPIIPNVIVIMSEAFIDPTILYNVTFSQYPIPNFRRLSYGNLSGNVLVPVFGGGTASTEFEFLSGMPHVFFGSRFYVPHENPNRYFSRKIPTTMPHLFRENGYRTVGVHPFDGGFFNRNIIYPLIGFDEFIAREQMPNAIYRGQFISDEYFTDRIIEQIVLAEQDDIPLFLFGVSMQNHWGFEPMKYGRLNLDIMSESAYLDDNETARLNSFLQGIFDADKQLGRLADFVESRDTPTIIVFFGDHMPILGRHADRIFERIGFISQQEDFNWTLEDRIKMFQTQYLVWANYEIGLDDWGTVSSFMLGALTAEASGITLNRHFYNVLQGLEYFRGITNELYIDIDGTFHPGWQHRNDPHIQTLEAIWNISMFGEDELLQTFAELIGNPILQY